MDLQYLTPALERLWLDEVDHLDALWHSAAPRNPNPKLVPNPNLHAVKSTVYKKENARKRRERKRQKKLQLKQQHASIPLHIPPNPTVSDIEWPCEHIRDRNPEPSGWAVPNPRPAAAQPRPPISADEQARIAAMQAQQNGLRTCQDFFKNAGSDDEDEEEEEYSMEEGDSDQDGGESRPFKFFLELFQKDGDLKDFYRKNWEKGYFCCLVCGGIGAKLGKRFTNCVGLVQHSNSISNSKRKWAHRQFGRAVCQVLGWDINCLPGISLDLGHDLVQPLAVIAQATDDRVPTEME